MQTITLDLQRYRLSKTEVEIAKLVELVESEKSSYGRKCQLTSGYSIKKHQIREENFKLDVKGSIAVARSNLPQVPIIVIIAVRDRFPRPLRYV